MSCSHSWDFVLHLMNVMEDTIVYSQCRVVPSEWCMCRWVGLRNNPKDFNKDVVQWKITIVRPSLSIILQTHATKDLMNQDFSWQLKQQVSLEAPRKTSQSFILDGNHCIDDLKEILNKFMLFFNFPQSLDKLSWKHILPRFHWCY